MGLDIYLYTRAQQEARNAHSQAWDAWGERFGERPDDDPATKQSALEHEMGIVGHEVDCSECVKAAVPPYQGAEDVPSEQYPNHLFNRRYLRSSYNGSGFNRAVPDFLASPDLPSDYGTLSWIFAPVRGGEGYEVEFAEASLPKLEDTKSRALTVAEALRKCDPLRVMDANAMFGIADHMWVGPPTDDQVLAWYREEQARGSSTSVMGDSWYSTAKGTVFGFDKGAEILALTLGKDVLGRPCAMAVYRGDVSSYIESAEIVAEFCDEAAMLTRRDGGAYMHWSG